MNLFSWFLIVCFLVGLVLSSLKTRKFISTITPERAADLKFTVTWKTFLKNPFYGIVVVFLGAVEIVRIVLVIATQLFHILVSFVASTVSTVFLDHKSCAQCYNLVLNYSTKLTKTDLENIAKAYDVPMNHLLRIARNPTFSEMVSCTKERTRFLDYSGEQLDQLLNSLDTLGKDYLSSYTNKDKM